MRTFIYGQIKFFKAIPSHWNNLGLMNCFVGSEIIGVKAPMLASSGYNYKIFFHRIYDTNSWKKVNDSWWIKEEDFEIIHKEFKVSQKKFEDETVYWDDASFVTFCKEANLPELLI